jgi:hypothetical protein
VPKLVKGRVVVTGIKCKTLEADKRRLCDYNPWFTYFMNFNNRLYEFQITKHYTLLEFSSAHGAIFFYCIFKIWKLACAVEAEVNLTF